MIAMSRRLLISLATLGSIALFGGALAFQYIGHLNPCHLCLIERWPHRVAIAIGILALILPMPAARRGLAGLGALTMLVSGGLGLYHAGVEQHWWPGPTTCTSSGNVAGMSTDALLNQILAAPVAHCDQVAWEMFGLSMAGWNMVLSLVLALIWAWAALRRQ